MSSAVALLAAALAHGFSHPKGIRPKHRLREILRSSILAKSAMRKIPGINGGLAHPSS
jgi:hypothetical protein